MFFSSSKGYPMMVSSVIHYKPQEEQAKRARQKRIDERGAEAFQIPKRYLPVHSLCCGDERILRKVSTLEMSRGR